MVRIKGLLNAWIKGLAGENSELPSDPEEQRLRKAVLILLSVTYTIFGISWGITCFSLGRPLAGSFPLGYSAISAGSLVYFFVSKRFNFFCRIQLFLILILPFSPRWTYSSTAIKLKMT